MSRPYYKNMRTGIMSMDKRDMDRWVESGDDVGIWYYSEHFGWLMGMVREGRKKES